MKSYMIVARVRPASRNGWNSGGRQVPTFHVSAATAEGAARITVRVLLAAAPDAEYIDVTAYRSTEGTDAEEWGHASGGRDAQMQPDCVTY